MSSTNSHYTRINAHKIHKWLLKFMVHEILFENCTLNWTSQSKHSSHCALWVEPVAWWLLKLLSRCSLADVSSHWNGQPIHGFFAEEGTNSVVPTTVPNVSNLISTLQEVKTPDAYTRAVATMAYTAQRAKFASGSEKQQWTNLFIDSFRVVYGDLLGDPNKALGLC